MASRFEVPDSSPISTPDRKSYRGLSYSMLGDNPSTTPAGPPPSSTASFTPAGAPTDSYLGSSFMAGVTGSKPTFGGQSSSSGGKNLWGGSDKSRTPLGRSIRGGRGRQPSGLSRQFSAGDDDVEEEEEEEEDVDAEGEEDLPLQPGSLFRASISAPRYDTNFDEAEIERFLDEELAKGSTQKYAIEEKTEEQEEEMEAEAEEENEDQDAEGDELEPSQEGSEIGDMFLSMRPDDRLYGEPIIGEELDLMAFNTPAATNHARMEAEQIFKRSSAALGNSARKRGYDFSVIAKNLYGQMEVARITEPPNLVLKTEELVCRLYDEGIGPEEDEEKMDNSLANITFRLVRLWNGYVEELPSPEGEDFASVGPASQAAPIEKATFLAHLILRMHHTRFTDDNNNEGEELPPLPEILFDWLAASHNLYPDQVREISRYKPSPACHSLFWQTLRNALVRGDVNGALQLLGNAGWENVRRGPRGDYVYTGKSLENVRKFADETCSVLQQCPAMRSDWDIWNSSWTLFRIQAKGSLDRMTLFAEGRGQDVDGDTDDGQVTRSMSAMARKASSQLPWDIYENLQTLYGILLGNPEAIMETSQDWCEATIGLFGWWDDGNQHNARTLQAPPGQGMRASTPKLSIGGEYYDRLAAAFHRVVDSDLSPNAMNPVEVAIASAFEGNVDAVIGFLRAWSLPVACSVAEVASLGGWLPPSEAALPLMMDGLDLEDLAVLNVAQPTQEEVEGMKDSTLILYARELAGIDHLSPQRNGWELAIQVLGRIDLPQKSEETVGELLRDLLATLDEDSSSTVDKMWKILNDLGMINFAEETAETYADILSKESHRYGEALWYYALSHRTDKVREVLNLLISYSLIESAAYPPEKDLDEELRQLLRNRTDTLERRAKQDLEAAQLLGRMLSGYATLRKFYELRDEQKAGDIPSSKVSTLNKQAAIALVAVISSADDNIRGGLYDETRDAVVSEDFLLALLGEATVFVGHAQAAVTLDQIDILLKAVEDVQTVGSRVYTACDDFFNVVLSSGQGLKGSTPADLMKKSTASLGGSSYVLSGSSLLASQLHKSISAGSKIERGWDWRRNFSATTSSEDVLRKLRHGLAKDLAALWLDDADGVALY